MKSSDELVLTVSAGQESKADFTATTVELPETLVRSMALYKSLKGYRDSTIIETHVISPSSDSRQTTHIQFAFERPNRLRTESSQMGEMALISDGIKQNFYLGMFKQYTQKDAPDVLLLSDSKDPFMSMAWNSIVQKIILSDDPLKKLTADILDIKEVDSDKLDGVPVTIVDIIQPIGSLGAGMFLGGVDIDMFITVRLWIGSKDFLIRKVAYELDMEEVAKKMPEQRRAMMEATTKGMKSSTTESHTAIEIDPVFSDKDFVFIPPDGVELVEQLGQSGTSSRPSTEEIQLNGKPAPDFTLKDIEGNEAKLADFKGKVVLMDFWATWCGPCIKAMPHIQSLYEIYKEEDVIILGINSWERENDKVEPFLKEHKITYRILLDSNDEVIGKYGVKGIPTFFILDKKGIVQYSYTGMPPKRQIIQQNVEELLAE